METEKGKIKDVLERKVQLVRDSRHHKMYYQAVMDYHEYICSSKELTPILKKLIDSDKISPVYLRDIFSDFLIIQDLKYDVPTVHHYPNFYTPEIEAKYKLMKHLAELAKSEYDEINTPNKLFFDPNTPVIKTQRDEEYFYTQKLHNDIIEVLNEPGDTDDVFQPVFDDRTCTLHFQNEAIVISKKQESDPHKLMRTIFKDMLKVWANDEILEDWGYDFDEEVSEGKVYQAGKAVNEKIAQSTTIKDFLDVTTKSIAINKKYLAM